MLKSKSLLFALFTAGTLAAPAAHASQPKPQPQKPNKCHKIKLEAIEVTDQGVKLKVTGDLKCLKHNEDVKVTVRAEGTGMQAQCVNPGGQAPKGQNPNVVDVDVVAKGKVVIDSNKISKGKADFKVIAQPIDLEIDGAPDCPNAKWDEVVSNVSYEVAQVKVRQDGKTRTFECTFDAPTVNNQTQTAECEED